MLNIRTYIGINSKDIESLFISILYRINTTTTAKTAEIVTVYPTKPSSDDDPKVHCH